MDFGRKHREVLSRQARYRQPWARARRLSSLVRPLIRRRPYVRGLPMSHHHPLRARQLLPRREPRACVTVLPRPIVPVQKALRMLDRRLGVEHHHDRRSPRHIGQRVQLRPPLAKVGRLAFRLFQATANHHPIVTNSRSSRSQLGLLLVASSRRLAPARVQRVCGSQPVLRLGSARQCPVALLHLQVDASRAAALYPEVVRLDFRLSPEMHARSAHQLRRRRKARQVALVHLGPSGPPRPSRVVKRDLCHHLVARVLPSGPAPVGIDLAVLVLQQGQLPAPSALDPARTARRRDDHASAAAPQRLRPPPNAPRGTAAVAPTRPKARRQHLRVLRHTGLPNDHLSPPSAVATIALSPPHERAHRLQRTGRRLRHRHYAVVVTLRDCRAGADAHHRCQYPLEGCFVGLAPADTRKRVPQLSRRLHPRRPR